MTLLSGGRYSVISVQSGAGRYFRGVVTQFGCGRYFRIKNFVCKRKTERFGKSWFLYGVQCYYTVPSSLLVFSSVIFSRNFLRSFLRPFTMTNLL